MAEVKNDRLVGKDRVHVRYEKDFLDMDGGKKEKEGT